MVKTLVPQHIVEYNYHAELWPSACAFWDNDTQLIGIGLIKNLLLTSISNRAKHVLVSPCLPHQQGTSVVELGLGCDEDGDEEGRRRIGWLANPIQW